jgi:hypothetical protein
MGIVSPLDGYNRRMTHLDVECLGKIREAINGFRREQFYRGTGRRVPLRQFAELCGLSRQSLYAIIKHDRKGLEHSTRDRILAAINLVNQGLRFKRVIIQKAVVERTVHQPAIFEWRAVMPDGRPAPLIPQPPLSARQLAARRASAQRSKDRAKLRLAKLRVVSP